MRLLLTLDRTAPVPLHRQIESQIRAAILAGRLRPGYRIPGVRSLAGELGVARNTVEAAYEQLAADGYLEREVGAGSRVATDPPRALAPGGRRAFRAVAGREPVRTPALVSVVARAPRAPIRDDRAPAAVPGGPIDLRPGRMDLGLVPDELWGRHLQRAWRELREARTSAWHDTEGDPALRAALAGWLGAARGVLAHPDEIVVLGGAQAAAAIAARVWLEPGRTCLVEDPSDPIFRRAFEVTGARLAPVPGDAAGMRVDLLAGMPAAMAVVTPAALFPTGAPMTPERGIGLLRWASGAGAVIVENDVEGHLALDGGPRPALQSADLDGRVILVGSFSTLLYPGARTAFAVVPPALRAPFLAMAQSTERGAAAVEQRALARFVEEGHLERHVMRLRRAMADRHGALLAGLASAVPDVLLPVPARTGMQLVADTPDPAWPASRVLAAARAAGILLAPLDAYRLAAAPDRGVVLAFGAEPTTALREVGPRLARAFRLARPTLVGANVRRPQVTAAPERPAASIA